MERIFCPTLVNIFPRFLGWLVTPLNFLTIFRNCLNILEASQTQSKSGQTLACNLLEFLENFALCKHLWKFYGRYSSQSSSHCKNFIIFRVGLMPQINHQSLLQILKSIRVSLFLGRESDSGSSQLTRPSQLTVPWLGRSGARFGPSDLHRAAVPLIVGSSSSGSYRLGRSHLNSSL